MFIKIEGLNLNRKVTTNYSNNIIHVTWDEDIESHGHPS